MPKDIKQRLERARHAVASWLPLDAIGKGAEHRISTPQLVKRTLHVSYDSLSGSFVGVPDKWLPEFRSRLQLTLPAEPSKPVTSFASLPASSMLSLPTVTEKIGDHQQADGGGSSSASPPRQSSILGRVKELEIAETDSTARWVSPNRTAHDSRLKRSQRVDQQQQQQQQQRPPPVVWFDHCSRRFVNLPPHWRERLQRNSLTDWPEFQRNPALLTAVFTMMDEELRKMDLAALGLDSSVHTSAESPEGPGSSQHEQDASDKHNPSTATGVGVVWRQQRSFVRDDDSDSEEFTDI